MLFKSYLLLIQYFNATKCLLILYFALYYYLYTEGGGAVKSYNVKEIAEMLNTNPETVRRWIRDKKLDATIVSKKGGAHHL